MNKPRISTNQLLENQQQSSAIELKKRDCTSNNGHPESKEQSESSFSLLIATKIKGRIPSIPLQSPSARRLTVGLRQTLRSASGTLHKLTHPQQKLPTSEKQVVQEVLSHRRLSRKKI